MFCTKCGTAIKDGFKFCPKCGTPVYAEKEESQNKVMKKDVDEDANEVKAPLDNKILQTEATKNTVKKKNQSKTKSKAKSVSKKKEDDSTQHVEKDICHLLSEELDIDGIKEKAESGDIVAMCQQAFRYQTGIGSKKDVEKAKELLSRIGGRYYSPITDNIIRATILPYEYYK